MLTQDALRHAALTLHQAGIENPRREARLLAAHALNLPPTTPIPATADLAATTFPTLIARRAAREPLAYITGTRGFWTIELAVSPATLIPRPDSETLIEAALAHFPSPAQVTRILDLGTGTGALLLAALTEFPNAHGIGTDLSPQAASLAAANAAALGLAHRAAFLAADWAAPLHGQFELILCNPPYIPTADIQALMPEVAVHEPASALNGGPDGLREYARLIPQLPSLLAPCGLACLELGAGQFTAAAALAAQAGFPHSAARQDLGGHTRVLLLPSPVQSAPA
jgi:release factor glutamine methyltransferase